MFESVIKLLTSHLRVLREHQNDKTGVLTQYSKDEAAKNAVEYEQAIATLNTVEAANTSTNNASPKLPNPPCMVCTNGDKYAGNHGNYCQWCGRQLRAIA